MKTTILILLVALGVAAKGQNIGVDTTIIQNFGYAYVSPTENRIVVKGDTIIAIKSLLKRNEQLQNQLIEVLSAYDRSRADLKKVAKMVADLNPAKYFTIPKKK